jgi:hypothetical protein
MTSTPVVLLLPAGASSSCKELVIEQSARCCWQVVSAAAPWVLSCSEELINPAGTAGATHDLETSMLGGQAPPESSMLSSDFTSTRSGGECFHHPLLSLFASGVMLKFTGLLKRC